MIVYRNITREDALAVSEYALRVLRDVAADQPLHIAPMKVGSAVSFFAKDASGLHFNLAAFDDCVCVGAIAAFAAEMTYFERQEAHVMFAHATLPGVGMRLLRELVGWARSEPRIRRLAWMQNPGDLGERVARVMSRRLGFAPQPMLVWTKE